MRPSSAGRSPDATTVVASRDARAVERRGVTRDSEHRGQVRSGGAAKRRHARLVDSIRSGVCAKPAHGAAHVLYRCGKDDAGGGRQSIAQRGSNETLGREILDDRIELRLVARTPAAAVNRHDERSGAAATRARDVQSLCRQASVGEIRLERHGIGGRSRPGRARVDDGKGSRVDERARVASRRPRGCRRSTRFRRAPERHDRQRGKAEPRETRHPRKVRARVGRREPRAFVTPRGLARSGSVREGDRDRRNRSSGRRRRSAPPKT
jgi:hypothetical protein